MAETEEGSLDLSTALDLLRSLPSPPATHDMDNNHNAPSERSAFAIQTAPGRVDDDDVGVDEGGDEKGGGDMLSVACGMRVCMRECVTERERERERETDRDREKQYGTSCSDSSMV